MAEEMEERGDKGFMTKDNFHVNSWITIYVYETFWDCLISTGNVNMGLRFMIDRIIQMREENALADTKKFDVMIDVIKFVLHILECDPEDNASVEEMRATEDKLWELCQSFKDGQLINLVLDHNIVANIKREDFQAARVLCLLLDESIVTMD